MRCDTCDGTDAACPDCDGKGVARCAACPRPATTHYPPDADHGEPSCGRMACEYRMQAAQDYHDERGG